MINFVSKFPEEYKFFPSETVTSVHFGEQVPEYEKDLFVRKVLFKFSMNSSVSSGELRCFNTSKESLNKFNIESKISVTDKDNKSYAFEEIYLPELIPHLESEYLNFQAVIHILNSDPIKYIKEKNIILTLKNQEDIGVFLVKNPFIVKIKEVDISVSYVSDGEENRTLFSFYIYCDSYEFVPFKANKEKINKILREIIKKRSLSQEKLSGITPRIKQHMNENEAEKKALDYLRDLISEKEWQTYINKGFLSIRGKSGKNYLVFRNRAHTKVFENKRLVKEICIRTDENCPWTDHVINLKIMIENEEDAIWKNGNIYEPIKKNISAAWKPPEVEIMNLLLIKKGMEKDFKFFTAVSQCTMGRDLELEMRREIEMELRTALCLQRGEIIPPRIWEQHPILNSEQMRVPAGLF